LGGVGSLPSLGALHIAVLFVLRTCNRSIDLSSKNLAGSLPSHWGNMTALTYVWE
jgi:hypothetical protein